MNRIKIIIREAVRNIDPVLFGCCTLLSLVSLLTIYGAVDNFGVSKLKMQLAIFIIGNIVTFLIAFLDYRAIVKKLFWWLLLASVGLLAITLVFGSSGAARETTNKSWLEIPLTGFSIQPSEFVKVSFICTFAYHLFRVQKRINRPATLLWLFLHAGIVIGLILLSGDLGVALVYTALVLLMLFCAGMHPLYFLGIAVVAVLGFPFLWDKLALYQQQRIIVGFNPELDPLGKGLQPLLSRTAIAAGGFFGNGIFGGSYYEDLPASHTDFIFATVCEKFGFLGGGLVILTYMVLVVRIFMLARTACRSDCGGLICVGVGAVLVVQVFENIGMSLAMLPVVGITLPFLSCGGSSMLATYMMIGLVHNVSGHSNAVRAAKMPETFDIDSSLLR